MDMHLAAPPSPSPSPSPSPWTAFTAINGRRRAIRDFSPEPIDDDDVRAVVEQATLAPSSGNLQPYEIHWVRDPELKARVAEACEGQRAATSAPTLLVLVAAGAVGRRTAAAQLRWVEESGALDERAKAYHRKQLAKFGAFLRYAPLFVWGPLHALLALLFPALTLVPIGPIGQRHWAARSAIYAAQTLLLAAVARGLDACPMEGFDARAVARILGLPRGHVVPIVIALGRRAEGARVEPRWRRAIADVVRVH
jgi:nitroreductase